MNEVTSRLPVEAPAHPERLGGRHAPLLLSTLGLLLIAYSRTLLAYPDAWLENRVHAFGLAGLAIFMLWRTRSQITLWRDASSLVIAPLLISSLLWAAGVILSIQLLHQTLLPILLFGWWYAVAGKDAAVAALPAFLVALLAMPFWGGFVVPLQYITVAANTLLLSLTGLEAEISGTYIKIPAGVFEVARGCSGANYFESGVVISVIYSLFFLKHWRARGVAVLVGALVAAVSNWLRVFGLILIGHVTEMQSPLIKNHNGYGWVVFAAVILLYFLFARRFEAYDDRLRVQASGDAGGVGHSASASRWTPLASLGWPTTVLLVGPLLVLLGAGRTPASLEQVPEVASGLAVGTDSMWRPTEGTPAWTPVVYGAADQRSAAWRKEHDLVQVDRFIFLRQQQGREMVNALNSIVSDKDRLGGGLIGPLDANGRMVNASLFRVAGQQWMAWHWYLVGGVITYSGTEAKLLELPMWFGEARPSEIVVVSTPCEDEQCRRAQARLFEFVTGRPAP